MCKWTSGTVLKYNTSVCAKFKDKNKIIELPCAVGDVVYVVNDKKVLKCKVTAIRLDTLKNNKRICVHQAEYAFYPYRAAFKFSSIGKTVFLTEAEAEHKLKELKDNE